MTVDEMLGRMSAHEYSEWIAFDSLEPVGPFGLAHIWAMFYNAWRAKNATAVDIHQCPFLYEPKPEQSDEEVGAIVRSLCASST